MGLQFAAGDNSPDLLLAKAQIPGCFFDSAEVRLLRLSMAGGGGVLTHRIGRIGSFGGRKRLAWFPGPSLLVLFGQPRRRRRGSRRRPAAQASVRGRSTHQERELRIVSTVIGCGAWAACTAPAQVPGMAKSFLVFVVLEDGANPAPPRIL
jgi:hypothetical protein